MILLAGDAILTSWKVDNFRNMKITVAHVITCALNIQTKYGKWKAAVGIDLRVKIGEGQSCDEDGYWPLSAFPLLSLVRLPLISRWTAMSQVGVARFVDASIYRDTFPAIRIAILFFIITIFFIFFLFFGWYNDFHLGRKAT